MQQRRLRLGDTVDDYCPRERRITNHAIVAIVGDEVKQTRCTTCDADHEYKQARIPAQRKKKGSPSALESQSPDPSGALGRVVTQDDFDEGDEMLDADHEELTPSDSQATESPELVAESAQAVEPAEDDGPVHRPLIRATLPRPEGQVPERKLPDFTVRQPGRGSRFDHSGNGNRHGQDQRRSGRAQHSQSGGGGQQRFGGPRHGGDGRPGGGGNRSGQPGGGGQRQGRPGGGQGQGQGQSRGRKRGR